jgi:predicted dehydrogenase
VNEGIGPMRGVLAGCGEIAGTWLQALTARDDVVLVGLADVDERRARSRREAFGLDAARIGSDVVLLLEQLRPEVVFDCTPPEVHATVACAALERGCHVLAEKPMAATPAEAADILATARRVGRTHAVCQQRRYHRPIRRFRELIQGGALGRSRSLHVDFFVGPHFGGFREAMEHVLLQDMAIHTFDQARFISGTDPLAVLCHEWNPSGSWYLDGASAVCVFTMSDGSVFTYRGSWCAEGVPTAWDGAWRAICTAGGVTWDGLEAIVAERPFGTGGLLRETESVEVPDLASPSLEGHAAVIHEFLGAVAVGDQPETCGADNVRSLAMVHAAIESAATRQWVPLRWPT